MASQSALSYRGEYERVIKLTTDNFAALPGDRLYESFGNFMPASVFDRFWLVLSLAELGRFAQAAEDEAYATRDLKGFRGDPFLYFWNAWLAR